MSKLDYKDLDSVAELGAALDVVDRHYQEMCKDHDEMHGYKAGTSYKDGFCCEMYIESRDWHRVSKALRKLKANSLL